MGHREPPMSTSTGDQAVLNANVQPERRFYPRVAPSLPIYVAFGPDNLGTLRNVSENGLQVSTPLVLDLNSVHRVFLCLSGVPDTITVHVRTVWTVASQNRSGIQLLDLSEGDRDQIRNWAAMQPPESATLEPWFSPAIAEMSAGATEPKPSLDEAPEKPDTHAAADPEPLYTPVKARPALEVRNAYASIERANSPSFKPLLIFWTASMATICMAAGWHFRHEFADRFVHRHEQIAKAGAPGAGQSPKLPAVQDEFATPLPTDAPADNDADAISVEPPLAPAPRAALPSNIARSKRLEPKPPASRPNLSQIPKPPAQIDAPVNPRLYIADSTPIPPSTNNASPRKNTAPILNPPNVSTAVPTTVPDSARPLASAAPTPALPRIPPPADAVIANSQTANSPAANSPIASRSTAPAISSDVPPHKSAINGSIAGYPPTTAPRTSYLASSSPEPARPPVIAPSPSTRSNNYAARSFVPSNSAIIQMDVPQPRTIDVIAPKGFAASFVSLPGEKVFRSPAVTVHVQRSVRVGGELWRWPADHLLWRTHKKVQLGELASRVDPQVLQISHQPPTPATIAVQATIEKDGSVRDIKPLYGSFALLPSVTRALNEWRYEPTYLDNKPVETQAKIEFDFHPPTTRTSRP
jgi:hypothetical protein